MIFKLIAIVNCLNNYSINEFEGQSDNLNPMEIVISLFV